MHACLTSLDRRPCFSGPPRSDRRLSWLGPPRLDRRPWHRGPVLWRIRVDAMLEQHFCPDLDRPDLPVCEPLAQVGAKLAVELRSQAVERLHSVGGERVTPPLPQHRAQLVFLREADPVVAAV